MSRSSGAAVEAMTRDERRQVAAADALATHLADVLAGACR